MSNIERQNGRSELVKALALLSILPHAPTITEATLIGWGTALDDARISPSELVEGARRLLQKCEAWPAPAQLIEACREIRRRNAPASPLPPPTGEPITPEQRDEILRGLKNPEFALEVIEGRGKARTYRIHTDDAVIPDVEARRDDQIRRMREGNDV